MSRILSVALVSLFVFAGSDAHGAAPPLMANGRIAFTAAGGIASMNPDGTGQWGVELQVGDTQPAWSPDGAKLAVVTHWVVGQAGIELLQPNGDALGMLTTDPGDYFPAWSPDGSTVAFTNGGNIWLVNADGTGRRELTTDTGASPARPTWSPDGSTIAFAAYHPNAGTHIYSVDVSTAKEKALTLGNTYDADPAWSPDGSTILFSSTRGGNQAIYAMNPDGTSVRLVGPTSGYSDYAAWSPDGTQIAFVDNSQIWVMGSDGSSPHQLSEGDYNGFPA